MINATTEEQNAISEAMSNAWNPGWVLKMGLPVLSSLPPGTVREAVKVTPAMSAAR